MWPMKPIEITLHPVDNLRLANLCGAIDENIRQIELLVRHASINFYVRVEFS